MHELLPWHVNGTLDAADRAAFDAHLAGCEKCRRESDVLVALLENVRRTGGGALSEHPQPEVLHAALDPGEAALALDADSQRAALRHLAICPTCAEEAEWLRGRAVASAHTGPTPVTRRDAGLRLFGSWQGLAAAAAVVVVAFAAGRFLRPEGGGSSGPARLSVIAPVERAAPATSEIAALPGEGIHLLLEVDLAPEDFPARLQLATASGRIVVPSRPISPDDLSRGAFLLIACRANDCPPGDYVATVTPGRTSRPTAEYRFRVKTAR